MEQTKNTRITVKGIMSHITYEIQDPDQNQFTILWDYENEKVDKLMWNEYRPSVGDKLNMMWVEKVKELSKWSMGETLYVFLKNNCDGCFYVNYSRDKNELGFVDVIIEPSGYISRTYFNNYTFDETDDIKSVFYVRTECVYNDKICKMLTEEKKK